MANLENPEKRFRLRRGSEIVGYMRKVSATMVLYSSDGFWWKGHKPEYSHVDEYTGLRDKNNRHIYEWDILRFKLDPDGAYRSGAVLWEAREEEFGIRDLEGSGFIPLFVNGVSLFNGRQTEVFSYLFINPELLEQLGLQE